MDVDNDTVFKHCLGTHKHPPHLWTNRHSDKIHMCEGRTLKYGYAKVQLFDKIGRFIQSEDWKIPEGASQPSDMATSKDFRRIEGGPVVIPTQEPFGYPTILTPDTWDDYGYEAPSST